MTITKDLIEIQSHGVGSGDAAGVLGISPFASQTPLQIYMRKRGEIPRTPDTPAMRFGRLIEGGIINAFEEDSGLKVQRFKHPDDLLHHSRHKFMVAMLDGFVVTVPAVVEAKSTVKRDHWGEPFSDEIPAYYNAQVQHAMAVKGARGAYLPVVFLMTREITFYYVTRNDRFIRNLIDAEQNFWVHHVLAGNPPKPETSGDAAALWPKSIAGDVHPIGVKVARGIADMKRLDVEAKAIDDERESLATALRIIFEDHEALSYNGKVVATYKHQASARVDLDRLKRRHPLIYKRMLRKSHSRVLRLK